MNEQFDLSTNILALGDNIDLIKMLPDESIGLICTDPPFNSNRNYNTVDNSNATIKGFRDKWKGGSQTYLENLENTLQLLPKKMKKDGIICVHCDKAEGHYIKELLDYIFGRKNFINEIIWHYRTGGVSKRWLARKHDTIFVYSKSDKYTFNPIDVKKYYKDIYPENPNFKPAFPDRRSGEDAGGCYKYEYLDDVWDDIPAVFNKSKEYCGYPTQKPIKLYRRLISLFSNKNDIILDPYMGSGTTCIAAVKSDRKYVGFDYSSSSLLITKSRLDELNLITFDNPYITYKHWFDYNEIRDMPPFEFEKFIVEKLGGIANEKQVHDMGIDGRIFNENEKIAIQVKRHESVGRDRVDALIGAMNREGIKNGIIAAFSFNRGSEAEAARLRRESEFNIELKEIKDIIKINMPPSLNLDKKDNIIMAEAYPGEKDNIIVNYSWWVDKKKGLPYHKFDGRRRLIHQSKEFDLESISAKKIICMVTDDKGSSTIKEIEI